MNAAEILQVCRLVKALCPSQTFDEFTPDAWTLVLGRFGYADAKQALAEIASAPLEPGRSRYIEPGHIVGGINRIRSKRVADTMFPEPPAGLTAAEYATWENRTREAIASGTYRPTERLAIGSATEGQVKALIHEAARALPKSTTPKAKAAEVRAAIDNEAAERERARQLAALEAFTQMPA